MQNWSVEVQKGKKRVHSDVGTKCKTRIKITRVAQETSKDSEIRIDCQVQ